MIEPPGNRRKVPVSLKLLLLKHMFRLIQLYPVASSGVAQPVHLSWSSPEHLVVPQIAKLMLISSIGVPELAWFLPFGYLFGSCDSGGIRGEVRMLVSWGFFRHWFIQHQLAIHEMVRNKDQRGSIHNFPAGLHNFVPFQRKSRKSRCTSPRSYSKSLLER